MKKILGSIFLLLIISTTWLSAQCPGGNSPEPTCIRVLPNGDVEVDYDVNSFGPVPTDITEFRLERSPTGLPPWTIVTTTTVGAAWPIPTTITDVGANAANQDWVYRIVAECVGPPLTDLLPSSIIRSIRLKYTLANDFEISLFWNWDSLSTNLNPTVINRKIPYTTTNWSGIGIPTYQTSAMSYVDTVITCLDSVSYRIVLSNQTAACQSISSEVLVRVEDITPPNTPKIDTVSFDPVSNKPLITWNMNSKTDTWGYFIIFHPNGDCGTSSIVDTVFGRNNTKLIDNTWYNGIEAGQYAVFAFDGCFNVSQKSACVRSMQLLPTLDVCEKSVQLTWNEYTNFASGTDVLYKVFVSISGSAFVYVGSSSSNIYVHEDPIPNELLTYKIIAVENGGAGPKTTSSNRVNVNSEFLRLPAFEYLRYATVQEENYVRLELYTDTKNDVATYVLKRALDTSDVFTTVNVFNAPNPKLPVDSITLLSDVSALTDKFQNFYRVDMFDSCGSYMTSSNLASTSYLKVTVDNVKRVNRLEWTNVIGREGEIIEYNIYRTVDGVLLKPINPLTVLADTVGATTVYYDFLNLINSNAIGNDLLQGNFCYYVEAIETDPASDIPPVLSNSNTVCVVQQPYSASPNSFTPNGDGRNERFKPSTIYHDLTGYELYVMNRYGEVVYKTNNAKASWDGNYNGEPVPEGVYVYSIKYKSSTGEQFENKGTISVIR